MLVLIDTELYLVSSDLHLLLNVKLTYFLPLFWEIVCLLYAILSPIIALFCYEN